MSNVQDIHAALFKVINEKGENLTDTDMAPFVAETVVHNNEKVARSELAHNTTLAFKSKPGTQMRFHFETTKVKDNAGTDADGRPRQSISGILSLKADNGTADASNGEGGFSEQFTYIFAGGILVESLSKLDKDGVKDKMAAAAA